MVQKYSAKKKLWGSKVDEIAFLLAAGDYGTCILCGHETIGKHGNGCNRIATRK